MTHAFSLYPNASLLMRNATAFLLALSLLALPACDSGGDDEEDSVSIEGEWQSETFEDGSITGYLAFDFETDGSNVTGTTEVVCNGCDDEGTHPLEGTYDFPSLNFTYSVEGGTGELDCSVQNRSLMECELVNAGGFTFEVTRQ